MTNQPDEKPLLYRKPKAYRLLGIGKTTGDRMVANGDLVAVRLGRRAVAVTAESVERVAREGVTSIARQRRSAA